MSVIIGRALPDARDGLKPAHRRVLYGMKTMGLSADARLPQVREDRRRGDGQFPSPRRRSRSTTRWCGWRRTSTCATRWSTARATSARSTAIRPAAMRYTEARLQALADDAMADLDKETVDFTPNYDETTEEPTVLPAPFPNLLVNGSAGIAVGMATNVPPHNLREVIDGCIWLIENTHFARGCGRASDARATSCSNLIRLIPAPDFPTGRLIVGRAGRRAGLHDRPRLDPDARAVGDRDQQEGRPPGRSSSPRSRIRSTRRS